MMCEWRAVDYICVDSNNVLLFGWIATSYFTVVIFYVARHAISFAGTVSFVALTLFLLLLAFSLSLTVIDELYWFALLSNFVLSKLWRVDWVIIVATAYRVACIGLCCCVMFGVIELVLPVLYLSWVLQCSLKQNL